MVDGALGEEVAQAGVAGVGPGIVGLHAPGGDAVVFEEAERPLDERGHRCGLLVAVDLGVGQAAVVVDHRVTELPAHALALLGARGVTVAGHGVPGPQEARQALGVHLQQIAGTRPLIPADRLARCARRAAHLPAGQTARDRRVRQPELGGEQPWSPARPPARLTDTVMPLLADPRGLVMGRRGAILGPRAGRPLRVAGRAVAVDPVLHRRDAHATPGRGLASRQALLKTLLDQLDTLPSRQPPTLVWHPG
jgi:hypothetical protein